MKLPTPATTNLTALHNDNHTLPTEAPAPADFSDRDLDLDLDLDHVLYDGGWHWDNASDYVYDYDESVSSLPVEELVVNAVGYGLVLLLGMVGNVLVVISVARYRRMHNVTNIFLLSLATADLLLVCICIPVKFVRFFTFTWRLGVVMCKGVHYLQNVSIICSVLNLIGLSLERYYAILHPMRARYKCTVKLARRIVLILWALSVVMALPILVGQEHVLVGWRRKGYWCLQQWPEPVMHQVYQLYMLLVVYLLPLTFMTCTYVSICRRLWQVRYQRASIRAAHSHSVRCEPNQPSLMPFLAPPSSSGASDACLQRELRHVVRQIQNGGRCKRSPQSEDATRKQVVKMLVAVVVLFAVSWGPILFNNVLVAFGVLEQLHLGWLKPMRQVFWLLAYLNSSLNPIVYGFMSKNFRESFRNTMWRCVMRRPPNKEPGANIYWRCSFQPLPSGVSSGRSSSMFMSDSEGRHLSVPSVSIHRLSQPCVGPSACPTPCATPPESAPPSVSTHRLSHPCVGPDLCATPPESAPPSVSIHRLSHPCATPPESAPPSVSIHCCSHPCVGPGPCATPPESAPPSVSIHRLSHQCVGPGPCATPPSVSIHRLSHLFVGPDPCATPPESAPPSVSIHCLSHPCVGPGLCSTPPESAPPSLVLSKINGCQTDSEIAG